MRRLVRVLHVILFAACAAPSVAGPQLPPATPGLAFDLSEVAPGVHVAVARGVPYYVANSIVIQGDDEVLLIDSSAGPGEARVLREAVRWLTPKPVRYVVETHLHFDHALGHAAFPDAVRIAHAATRDGLALGTRQPTLANNLAGLPARASALRTQAAAEPNPARKAAMERDAVSYDTYARAIAGLVPSPPPVTFTDSLTIWLGQREVRLLHLGRGHTAGDTVVFLPAERVVCTGDLFNGYIGYMGDAYVDEWASTLDRLAQLDFVLVVAGHGAPFSGKGAIAPVQAVLRDVWRQAEALKGQGLSARDAAARIDLRAHALRFPPLGTTGYAPLAVERIYAVMDERAAARR